MGGYDIFMSKWDEAGFKALGQAREYGLPREHAGRRYLLPALSPDGSYAYLSSYRIGGYGEKDIYTINYIK